MPTYRKGTRQWAEAHLLTLETMQCESFCEHRSQEISDMIEELDSLPEGSPTYSQAELEAMGQGTMFTGEIA